MSANISMYSTQPTGISLTNNRLNFNEFMKRKLDVILSSVTAKGTLMSADENIDIQHIERDIYIYYQIRIPKITKRHKHKHTTSIRPACIFKATGLEWFFVIEKSEADRITSALESPHELISQIDICDKRLISNVTNKLEIIAGRFF